MSASSRWTEADDRLQLRLVALLRRVEAAVDAVPELTRTAVRRLPSLAGLTFDESGWAVEIKVRNRKARGRGARAFCTAMGCGKTPEEAVDVFLERLPLFTAATS